MAFNPLKRVREKRYPTAFQEELAGHLKSLADLPPATDTPYLTVSLDWRPSGSDPEYRGARQRFDQESKRLLQEHWPRGDVYDSLEQDIEQIDAWLTNEVPPSAKGAFIVSNSGAGVFEAITLGMALETKIASGAIPALLPLARLEEDNPTYAVLLVDQQQGHLMLISQGHRTEQLALSSSDYPRKQATGGWSQRRFQQRADERIQALARQVTEETQEYLESRGVDALIIAGDEVIRSALDAVMSDVLKEIVIETVRLDIDASADEILEETLPIARSAELERELESVTQVADLVGAGNGAVAGSNEVLQALVEGRASHLVINEDFHEDGWAAFAESRYGSGENHDIFGGSFGDVEVTPIVVEEAMVQLAISTGAEIDIIHVGVERSYDADDPIPDSGEIPRSEASTRLDELGGVAAVLRY